MLHRAGTVFGDRTGRIDIPIGSDGIAPQPRRQPLCQGISNASHETTIQLTYSDANSPSSTTVTSRMTRRLARRGRHIWAMPPTRTTSRQVHHDRHGPRFNPVPRTHRTKTCVQPRASMQIETGPLRIEKLRWPDMNAHLCGPKRQLVMQSYTAAKPTHANSPAMRSLSTKDDQISPKSTVGQIRKKATMLANVIKPGKHECGTGLPVLNSPTGPVVYTGPSGENFFPFNIKGMRLDFAGQPCREVAASTGKCHAAAETIKSHQALPSSLGAPSAFAPKRNFTG